MTACTEWVVYRLKQGTTDGYEKSHEAVIEALRDMEGFLEFESMKGIKDSLLRLDKVVWKDARCALAGFEAFQSLAVAKPFMDQVASIEFSGHFLPAKQIHD